MSVLWMCMDMSVVAALIVLDSQVIMLVPLGVQCALHCVCRVALA